MPTRSTASDSRHVGDTGAFLSIGIPYETQIWIFRGAFSVVPVAGRIARELQAAERLSD